MHILVTNDDGPPSNQSSPYVHSLVKNLQDAGHIVSVILPHTQRSWIGKAHIIGKTLTPTYFTPGTLHRDDGVTRSRPTEEAEEWILVDGTPASCVQIGLYHFFKEKGPIDLVISGPNYGRNSSAVFSLSSGTIGGALEAAVCKRKAIALSYAFFSRNHDPEIIAGASKLSVKLIEYLYKNWSEGVDLYTVNVPLVENVGDRKVMWTHMLQNYWGNESCFEAVEAGEASADEQEQAIREGETNSENTKSTKHTHKHFKWAPRFTDVYKSVEEAGPGNSDGWVVKEGYTSITPLKANFMQASTRLEGELKLQSDYVPDVGHLSIERPRGHFHALINYEDTYVQPILLQALNTLLSPDSYTLINSISDLPTPMASFLQIGAYESLPFEHVMSHSTTSLCNAYIIRKALIRKHYLTTTAFNWTAKHPNSILKTNMKPACDFELDYAEFLDEALVEAWELQTSFQNNEEKPAEEREWWILKPGMSDRGQGIRLFSSEEELQSIFEEWEEDQPDSDDEGIQSSEQGYADGESGGDGIVTSHLRHFIAQPYIHPPLLVPGNPRKFHIRTYILASGSLKIHVYKQMLALFASTPYIPPWSASSPDLSAHLTNTCLQSGEHDGSVQAFWSLSFPDSLKENIFKQICETTGEVFEAAAKGMMIHFQTIPNAFEVFGLDYLVDEAGTAWLLEVNAFPDFRQTGAELKSLIEGLWMGVVREAVVPFFGVEAETQSNVPHSEQMVLVRSLNLGRK